MIYEQECKPPSVGQVRLAQQLGIDTEGNQMSAALAGYYAQKEIMFKKLHILQRNRRR